MKTYKVFVSQPQRVGCGHTIDCGKTIITIHAENMEGALKQFILTVEEGYIEERELETAEIYEVAETYSVNMPLVYSEINSHQEQVKDEEDKKRELELLKQLKQKYPQK